MAELMGAERKLRMVLVKNEFTDVIEKHMRNASTQTEKFDVAASALFVAAGFIGRAAGMSDAEAQDALNLASTLLRENKLR